MVCHGFNFENVCQIVVQLCLMLRVGFQPQETGTAGQRFGFLKTQFILWTCLCFKQSSSVKYITLKITNGMQCRPINVLLCLFIEIYIRIQGSRIQDSGIRKRAVNHSIISRQLIPGYRGSKKIITLQALHHIPSDSHEAMWPPSDYTHTAKKVSQPSAKLPNSQLAKLAGKLRNVSVISYFFYLVLFSPVASQW